MQRKRHKQHKQLKPNPTTGPTQPPALPLLSRENFRENSRENSRESYRGSYRGNYRGSYRTQWTSTRSFRTITTAISQVNNSNNFSSINSINSNSSSNTLNNKAVPTPRCQTRLAGRRRRCCQRRKSTCMNTGVHRYDILALFEFSHCWSFNTFLKAFPGTNPPMNLQDPRMRATPGPVDDQSDTASERSVTPLSHPPHMPPVPSVPPPSAAVAASMRQHLPQHYAAMHPLMNHLQ